jgi:hypothetical protein
MSHMLKCGWLWGVQLGSIWSCRGVLCLSSEGVLWIQGSMKQGDRPHPQELIWSLCVWEGPLTLSPHPLPSAGNTDSAPEEFTYGLLFQHLWIWIFIWGILSVSFWKDYTKAKRIL